MIVLALLGCQTQLVCREPDVSIETVEGEPQAACEVWLDRCEDDSTLWVDCSNDTFDGDYKCTWNRLAGVFGASAGTFDSDDFCRLGPDDMVDVIDEETPYRIEIDP